MDLDALIAKVTGASKGQSASQGVPKQLDLDLLVSRVKGRRADVTTDRAYYETSGGWLHGPWWEALGRDGPPYTWDDTGRYLHLARGDDDPERTPRGTYSPLAWRSAIKKPVRFWKKHIVKLLSDGNARTFNGIMVELANVTADMAFTDTPDQALWELVAEWKVAHGLRRPRSGGNYSVAYFAIPYEGETLRRIVAGRKDWYVKPQ